LAVPEETVSILAGVSSVFVISDGVVKQTAIQIGEREGKFLEVIEGLKGDEVLAASNLNELVSGSRIGAGGGGEEEGAPAASERGAGGGERRGGNGEFKRGGNGVKGEFKGEGKGGRGGRRGGGEGKGSAQ